MSAPLPKYKPGPELRINLYGVQSNGTTYMADGVFINYDETYSSKVDDLDALKIANGNENISIKNAGNFLAIERRHSIMERDTLHLNLSRMGTQAYRFQLIGDKLNGAGKLAFLEDASQMLTCFFKTTETQSG